MSDTEKYISRICIGGKRRGDMEKYVKDIFGNSFLSIEIPETERVFILRVVIYNDNDLKKIKEFKQNPKHTLCRIIPYKEIDFSILKIGKIKTS